MHVLGDNAGASSQVGELNITQRHATKTHGALGGFHQPQKQSGQRGLAAAGAAEHTYRCTSLQRQGQIVDDRDGKVFVVIAKRDVIKFQAQWAVGESGCASVANG